MLYPIYTPYVFISEEEGRPYFQKNTLSARAGPVTFYKHGQPTKVVHKPPPICYSSMRSQSCSDSDQDLEDVPAKRTKFDDLAQPAKSDDHTSEKAKAMMVRFSSNMHAANILLFYIMLAYLLKHDYTRTATPLEKNFC